MDTVIPLYIAGILGSFIFAVIGLIGLTISDWLVNRKNLPSAITMAQPEPVRPQIVTRPTAAVPVARRRSTAVKGKSAKAAA